ncbi:MAG TPA: triose-phosphate isomerase [Planctomycetota bacterium]|nr:triose-phosphate isomerase [Planctomycetota bacterium]
MARRSFVAGNWKMNKTPDEARALASELRAKLEGYGKCDVAVCPTFLAIPAVAEVLRGTSIAVGGQNLFWEKSGAYTGEISGPMLTAAGCTYVIIGHSERRQYFGETDETVNKRIKAALSHKLKVIFCVGETKDERLNNVTEKVVRKQMEGGLAGLKAEELASITIAYEPVWAIGTGLTATPAQAQEVHAFIRALIKTQFGASAADAIRIQYGGSVKADNAKELLSQPDIDGALVGGASLIANDFEAIVKAAK